MNDDSSGDKDSGATPWPFIGALTIILLVLLGIGGITLANRGKDSEKEAVVRAAIGQNDAQQVHGPLDTGRPRPGPTPVPDRRQLVA